MSGIIPQLIRNVLIRQAQAASGSMLKDKSYNEIFLSSKRLGHLRIPLSNAIHTSIPFEAVRDYKPGAGRRIILGTTKGVTATKLRGDIYDESVESKENISALESASVAEETDEYQLEAHKDIHNLFPDENTGDTLFNGVKYKDLPYVTIICTKNHTKFWANAADGKRLLYTTPRINGFLHGKKRTNVAAQATGLLVGQKLRQMNYKTIRVRVDGFNLGRISSITGITQAGINVASISDVTIVDWGWCQRAKKPKRRN